MRFAMLRDLAERRLVHRRLDLFVRAVHLDEARLDDARERRVRRRAHLDGLGDVTREDALLHRREEHVLVDRRAEQIERALDDDADRDDRPEEDDVHPPAAILEMLPQSSHSNRPPSREPSASDLRPAAERRDLLAREQRHLRAAARYLNDLQRSKRLDVVELAARTRACAAETQGSRATRA